MQKEETGSPDIIHDGSSHALHHCEVYKGVTYIECNVSEVWRAAEESREDLHKDLISCITLDKLFNPN